MSMKSIAPHTPLLYSKAGVYIFLLFLLQNIDCGYSARRFKRVPIIYVLSKTKKNIKLFPMKFSNFNAETILSISWASFC